MMHKTAKSYLQRIKELVERNKVQTVRFELAHYLNVRNKQIGHLQWLRDNSYIKARQLSAKVVLDSLLPLGVELKKKKKVAA